MTLEQLQALLDAREFHHATHRVDMAPGLHIYRKEDNGFNGFAYVGAFYEGNPDLPTAQAMVRKFGIYEYSYK